MSTSGNYLNIHDRGTPDQQSAFGTFADILYQRAEEKRKLDLANQISEQEFNTKLDHAKRASAMLNAMRSDSVYKSGDNTAEAKSQASIENPSKFGGSLLKIKPINDFMKRNLGTVSPMMSLFNGGVGNVSGNPIALTPAFNPNEPHPLSTMVNNVQNQQQSQDQQDQRYSVSLDSNFDPKIVDNQNELDALYQKAAEKGVNPYENGRPKTKTKIYSELAKNNLSTSDGMVVPDGYEIKRFTATGKPIVEKITNKPPTQAQETTALYASRIKQANDVFDSMEGFTNHQNALDYVQAGLPNMLNFMKGADMQSYQQAQRNFVNAVLRRESGAVISPSEFDNARQQYFPQPGDSPQVLAQKKANRDLVMKNFIASSRDAYVPYNETDTKPVDLNGASNQGTRTQIMVDGNGNKAEVEVDDNGKPIRVLREL